VHTSRSQASQAAQNGQELMCIALHPSTEFAHSTQTSAKNLPTITPNSKARECGMTHVKKQHGTGREVEGRRVERARPWSRKLLHVGVCAAGAVRVHAGPQN
jgi:hypothetical protein